VPLSCPRARAKNPSEDCALKTAIDSSVLVSIFTAEPEATAWLGRLVQARREGQLVICSVVYAEISAAFAEESALEEALRRLGVQLDPIGPAAAWRAGRSFRSYRDSGGPREHLIPDFLIAAHAQTQADRLAAIDRGYLRRYFSDLSLLSP
jgi:predicted nucleic acid-binding protein